MKKTTIILLLLGSIFQVFGQGYLYWHKHTGINNSTATWEKSKKIGSGWDKYTWISGGGNGVIYATDKDGYLYWFKHTGYLAGDSTWANEGKGKLIENNWNKFIKIINAGNGVFFACLSNGDLLWYKHLGIKDGSNVWHQNSGRKIGHGWDGVNELISGGDACIYAISKENQLVWYNYDSYTDANIFDNWKNGGINRESFPLSNGNRDFFCSNKSFYTVKLNGKIEVIRAKNDPRTTQPIWVESTPSIIAKNWNYDKIFANENGIIYTVTDENIEENIENEDIIFNIFPVPVFKNTLFITSNANIEEVEIYNVLGQLLQKNEIPKQKNAQLDVSDYPSGAYVLNIKINQKWKARKFCIIH